MNYIFTKSHHRIMYKKLVVTCTILACIVKFWTLDNPFQLSDEVAFSTISESAAQTLFDTLANLDYIEFRYANNHCEDRAHAMSYEIAEQGIVAGKAWIFVRGIFENTYPKVLKIHDANKIGKNNLLTWKYHVAPVVMSEQGDTLVLDPSLCETPVTLKEWFHKMNVKEDVHWDEIFFLIKDWKYQSYVTRNKVPRLLETWKTDNNYYWTKKGLCEGRLCQQFLDDNLEAPDSVRAKAKKFKELPKSYQKQKKMCLQNFPF